MSDNKLLHEYAAMSQNLGGQADAVQGGGGNTSVKLSGGRMAIKASGFRLNQIDMENAYAVVQADTIRNWYNNVDLAEDRDYEKESVEAAKATVVAGMGQKGLRPSVEVGFHAFLGTFVAHSHSVQANLLCCSAEGEELVSSLFTKSGIPALWIPYINPGFCLTLRIRDARSAMIQKTGLVPHVIFMENHGLIVDGEYADEALSLHELVVSRILKHFKITEPYPIPLVSQEKTGVFRSGTESVSAFIISKAADAEFFDNYPLYPDQLVYLNSGMAGANGSRKIEIEPSAGIISYHASEAEAKAMEETLLGYIWVLETIKSLGLTLKTMTRADVDFIKNWESEAYRRSLVQKMGKT